MDASESGVDGEKAIADPPRRKTARQAVWRRFVELDYADQIEFCVELAQYMPAAHGAALIDPELRARRDSLEALRRVTEHLGLDHPPTAKEFDVVRKELGLDWSSAKLVRTWGYWDTAKDALLGSRPRPTAAASALRRRFAGSKRRREESLTAVRIFVRSDSASDYALDYDAFVAEYNNALPEGELPLPRAATVRHDLCLPWTEVVAVARGEASLEAPSAERRGRGEWTRGPHDLIGSATVGHVLGATANAVYYRTQDSRFPRPVAKIGRRRVWLRDDVAAYAAGEEVPERVDYELQDIYVDADEYAEAVGVTKSGARYKGGVEPAGMAAGCLYWLRAEVEAWVRENRALVEGRKRRRRRPGGERSRGDIQFVGLKEIMAMTGLRSRKALAVIRKPDFPEPAAILRSRRIWYRDQIEAYLLGEAPPESAIEAKIMGAPELADLLGLRRAASRNQASLPEPAGVVAGRYYWYRDEVDAWLDEEPDRRAAAAERRRRR